LSISGLTPSASNSAQCGQVIDPNSTIFTAALGLPIWKPPSVVALTTLVQSPFLGGATGFTDPDAAALLSAPFSALQATVAKLAASSAMNNVRVVTWAGSG
jgi:hypothetical protein